MQSRRDLLKTGLAGAVLAAMPACARNIAGAPAPITIPVDAAAAATQLGL